MVFFSVLASVSLLTAGVVSLELEKSTGARSPCGDLTCLAERPACPSRRLRSNVTFVIRLAYVGGRADADRRHQDHKGTAKPLRWRLCSRVRPSLASAVVNIADTTVHRRFDLVLRCIVALVAFHSGR